MFNFHKFLVTFFLFCIVSIDTMERNIKAALGVSILAYLYREKANAELLNVIEIDVIPFYQKQKEFEKQVKELILQDHNNIHELTSLNINKMLNIEKETDFKWQKKIPEEYWEKIKKCLENGADPNSKTKIPLFLLTIKEQKKDFFNFLLHLRADINNSAAGITPLHFMVANSNFTKNPGSDGIQIEDLLQNEADPNVLNEKKESPLELAVTYKGDIDFIQPLINYRANVNHKDSFGYSILNLAISCNKKPAVIKALCDASASLTGVDNIGNTIFHILASSKHEELIKAVITHGHVDFKKESSLKEISCSLYEQKVVQITQTIKGALLIFNRLSYPLEAETKEKDFIKFPIIPHEIQLYILSKLFAEDYFHWGLYKKLTPRYKPCPFFLLNKHIECLIQILQIKNEGNITALQRLYTQNHDPEYLKLILPLFDESKLRHDLDEFKKLYNTGLIPEDNLVLKIYQTHYCNFQKTEKACKKS